MGIEHRESDRKKSVVVDPYLFDVPLLTRVSSNRTRDLEDPTSNKAHCGMKNSLFYSFY